MRDIKGYHFFTRLGQIFKRKTVLDRILYLNNEILRRNRSLAVRRNAQGELKARDVAKAAVQAKSKEKTTHEQYFAKDFVEFRLTFNSYRLLVDRVYADEPFPIF